MHANKLNSLLVATVLLALFHPGVLASPTIDSTTQPAQITLDEQWNEWKRTHNKQYASQEEHDRRRAEWTRTLKEITEHNAQYDLGLVTYTMGLNAFSDLSWEEFLAMYGCGKPVLPDENVTPFDASTVTDVLSAVDWRGDGRVGPVREQGACNSCWAFAASGAIEGQYNKKNKKFVEFSKQQLVDCSHAYGNHGCNNGTTVGALKYLRVDGLESAASYPYQGVDQTCAYNAKLALAKVASFSCVNNGNEKDLEALVSKLGPVTIATPLNKKFRNYNGNIHVDTNCTSEETLYHAMLLVGYGTENGTDFWIIKNSWGIGWGEQGYMRLARNRGNMCEVASWAVGVTIV